MIRITELLFGGRRITAEREMKGTQLWEESIRHTNGASSAEILTHSSMAAIAEELLSWDTERGVSGGSVDLSVSRDPLGSRLVAPPDLAFIFDPRSSPTENDLGVLIVLARGVFSSKLFIAAALVHLHQRQIGT